MKVHRIQELITEQQWQQNRASAVAIGNDTFASQPPQRNDTMALPNVLSVQGPALLSQQLACIAGEDRHQLTTSWMQLQLRISEPAVPHPVP